MNGLYSDLSIHNKMQRNIFLSLKNETFWNIKNQNVANQNTKLITSAKITRDCVQHVSVQWIQWKWETGACLQNEEL